MQLACPHCRKQIAYSGPAPDFCGFCGKLLAEDTASQEAETIVGPGEAAAPSALRSRQIGPYRLVEQLGQGGMGVVWRAEHTETARPVAIKLLASKLTQGDEAIERFLREGRMAAALSHPRTTFVLAAGQHDDVPYIVMELMPGATLKEVLAERGTLTIESAVEQILDVVDGLAAAHELGIIHRDVKPSNCFVDAGGRIKVGDFGLSKSLVVESHVTQTGAFMGTPEYTSPEQARGAKVDHRTDIYAVGATLYYLLAGRAPFVGDAVAVIAQISSDAPPPIRRFRKDVPPALERVIARTLEKDPARRYQNMNQLRAALEPFASASVVAGEPWRRFAAFALDSFVWLLLSGLASTATVVFVMQFVTTDIHQIYSSASGALAGFLYFFVLQAAWGRTLGMQVMGLRLVGARGETAGWIRVAARTLIFPCGLGLNLGGALAQNSMNANVEFLVGSLMQIVYMLVFVSCLVGMRRSNGYRGLHETLTGTRVIRARRPGARTAAPALVPGPIEESIESFGPFQPTGLVGHFDGVTVYQAHDGQLHRHVWIYATRDPSWVSEKRIALARDARPHWLERGVTADGRQWDAFQSVTGTPVSVIPPASLEWDSVRRLLVHLVDELETALDDGTLPDVLGAENVWLEPAGGLKLLDLPVRHVNAPPGGEAPAAAPADPAPAARAVQLVQRLVDRCLHGPVLPGNVQQFVAELAGRPAEPATLGWARQWLEGAAEQRTKLERRDRIGSLAVTVLFEFVMVTICSLLLPLMTTVLVAFIAWAVRGAPVFWLMRIEVRRTDGQPASRWRCMLRHLVTWGPYTLSLGALMPVPIITFFEIPPAVSLAASYAHLASWMVMALGLFYAIYRPQRGWQDLLVGTVLVPASSDDVGADLALAMMIPVGRSVPAIAAGYLGLVGMLVPPLGVVALGVSIWAWRTMKSQPRERGRGRIIFGMVAGVIGILECIALGIYLATEALG